MESRSSSLLEVDRKVRSYMKIYREQDPAELSPEERKVVDEFHRTWQVIRREMVPNKP